MSSPQALQNRAAVRAALLARFPDVQSSGIFDLLFPGGFDAADITSLFPLFEELEIPLDEADEVFQPYKVRDRIITKEQFKVFLDDEFSCVNPPDPKDLPLTDRQRFILSKFMGLMKNKCGPHRLDRWNMAIRKNPGDASKTLLRVAALLRMYAETNLPFSESEFLDALFAFYGKKCDSLTLDEYILLYDYFA